MKAIRPQREQKDCAPSHNASGDQAPGANSASAATIATMPVRKKTAAVETLAAGAVRESSLRVRAKFIFRACNAKDPMTESHELFAVECAPTAIIDQDLSGR
jgi:hypothetical protein